MNAPFEKYFDGKLSWQLIERVKADRDPVIVDLWDRAQSPIRPHAEKAASKLAAFLERRLACIDALQSQPAQRPAVPADKAIILGYEYRDPIDFTFQIPFEIDLNILCEHLAVFGSSGMGKTNFFRFLQQQLVAKGIFVEVFDYKGEGRSFPNAMVFRADQFPWNMLEPIGNSNVYYSAFLAEFASTFALRTETWPELVRVLLRVERGLKPGDPYPSLRDLERLLFAVAQSDDNPKFLTAATSFASLNAILGKTAHIRKAPDMSMRYPVLVHDYEGLPLRIYSFLNAIHLLRAQMSASVKGHA